MIASACGLDAWNAVIARLSVLLPISLGASSILIQGSFLLLSCIFNRKLDFTCVIPMIYKGMMLNVAKTVLSHVSFPSGMIHSLMIFLIGYAITGVSTGMYVSTGLPRMPIDSLHAAIVSRFHISFDKARLCLEGCGLIAAIMISGNIGIGTLIITTTLGRVISSTNNIFGNLLAYRQKTSAKTGFQPL